ncbi:MAG TPA: hypothetical protein VM661_15365 [Candidatus Sulfotelmatobacter sp.]|jgi:hypothetical protein|nr:hypothetical protein [Candidatus Sulfotelmatobacter sp.]
MKYRPLAAVTAIVLLALPLSGCGIPGGIAYAIKEGGKEMNKNGNQSADTQNGGASAEQTSAAPADPNPPPAPSAAPRDSISVETLK